MLALSACAADPDADLDDGDPDETAVPPGEWRNWSRALHCRPADGLKLPESVDEVADVVRAARGTVRMVGAGHSFSALVPTEGTLLSLEMITGVAGHDPAALTATIHAGTRLFALGDALAERGQGLQVQPDVDLQSLAGALSTCSHGSGAQLHCLPHYVTGLTLVTADGKVRTVSQDSEPEIFQAARVSMGALGVLTQVTMQNHPKYLLEERTGIMALDDALAEFAAWQQTDRHTEFFAFPRGETAFWKRTREVPAGTPKTVGGPAVEEKELGWASELGMRAPWTIPVLQRLAGLFVPDTVRVGDSWHIFPTVRQVPFNELEYAVPAEHGPACFREVAKTIREANLPVFFPLEYRHVGADDLWLSPYHGRPSVTISVHQFWKQDFEAFFRLVEPIFWKYQGRPHWGKWHSLTAKELAPMYAHWDDFGRVRRELDPAGKFLNPYLHRLLGV